MRFVDTLYTLDEGADNSEKSVLLAPFDALAAYALGKLAVFNELLKLSATFYLSKRFFLTDGFGERS